jgi:hypothetical protein
MTPILAQRLLTRAPRRKSAMCDGCAKFRRTRPRSTWGHFTDGAKPVAITEWHKNVNHDIAKQ